MNEITRRASELSSNGWDVEIMIPKKFCIDAFKYIYNV